MTVGQQLTIRKRMALLANEWSRLMLGGSVDREVVSTSFWTRCPGSTRFGFGGGALTAA